jgi:predicted nucleic acid-binding protein
VITLDASVVIAYFDRWDDHHEAARAFLYNSGAELTLNPITRAEALVRAAAMSVMNEVEDDLDALGITTTPFSGDAHRTLAELRVRTGLRMPDCCVLLTAQETAGSIATFDRALASAARTLGIEVAVGSDGADRSGADPEGEGVG